MLSERIKLARKESGKSQQQVGKIMKVSKAAVSKWENGESEPKNIDLLANALNVNINWLRKGVGEMRPQIRSKNAGVFDGVSTCELCSSLDDEFEVPFYTDVRLSDKKGFSEDIEDYNCHKLKLSKSITRKNGINKNSTICLIMTGNSMEPILSDGAIIAIDQTDKCIRDGKIYAINHDGLLRIKVLEEAPRHQVKIKSYNVGYDDEIVSKDEITILGRVWWQSSIFN